ncbi:MAG TPA: ABC transporter substrate-binding protein [Capillimicrobium sp.]|nr:ABC transporter substrate-binding protein [Capillimicrobium sp.]
MSTIRRALLALMLVAASAFLVAACGDDDNGGSTTGGGSTGAATDAATEGGQAGGTLTGYYTSSPDYMDPALTYTVEGWNAQWVVYTPLLTYRHTEGAEGAELIPGLAEDLPEISEDGLTYKLKLRDGLKFSDGTPVKASDFEHTIKRVLNLESGGSAFYLPIVGAEDYLKAGKPKADIEGIETNDETGEITIRLTERIGSFDYVLAMNFAGLVPGDTPFRNMTRNPPPGVGPYKITSSVPNRGFTLEKVPEFADFGIEDVPTGHLDKIDVTIVKNQQRQTDDIINNEVDYLIDPPPADRMREVQDKAEGRFEPYVTNSTYYVFMNTREKPFDDERVRQAVNFAIDKRAMQRIFGGLLAPSCNFLPPGMKGYQKIEPCPYGDPTQEPDLEKARQLIQEAGAEGTQVTVWGNDEDPSKPVTEYVADVMNQIGLDARPRIVEASVYFQTIGNQKTKAQAGFANWFQDFPHPANFMFLINGASIQETNNQNFGNVDDQEINDLIDGADKNTDLDAAAADYAEADRLAVERGYIAPYGNRQLTKLVSDRVNWESVVAHPVYEVDFSLLQLK